ncbi:undecaprenyl/decaprenyl-phosphate alpha-N-acetylglucosaminyl 1-phosphate transferase [Tumebacillus sp. ITR2]|uniref:Undecaprenyl/decaprenyl-phosphate alpha-N-acetylglucosaminyl 1-phosphate transferase n=1 Tax=Tumebacillus amylolyticus TaxID=2801339 RepID=A0ABS1J7G9_9BACL|nr:undecaprenyl/decaprenyl-phosphate alpha-N-acetylglucosaminyl 1-phosphate transferase [Tumebacillus amylolyticus]
MTVLWVMLAAALCSFLSVAMFRKIALRYGYVDKPNARKKQKEPLPMLGGLGMIVVFVLFVSFFIYRFGDSPDDDLTLWGILGGIAVLVIVGFLDDYAKTRGKDFPALPKFLGQIVATYSLILSGTVVHGVNIPFGDIGYITFNPIVGQVLTVLWVVGVINAFNFLDGVDGLAGGVAAIAAGTLLVVTLMMGQTTTALLTATLVGTTLGYLRHNFFPAKIIMGDTGSMFLGFMLAAISILGAFKSITIASVLVPVVALGLPIFDAFYVTIRRALNGKPIYTPDRTHAHHRLMDHGLNQKQAVVFLYLIATCLGLSSLVLTLI